MKIKIGEISAAVVQRVGNKSKGDGVSFSSEETSMIEAEPLITALISSAFKFNDIKKFDFVGGLDLNPVYRFASSIFDDNNSLVANANNLAKYLYEQSVHPSIKIGEFYVILFRNCEVEGELVDALGLFKSESQDSILRIVNDGKKLSVYPEKGMSLKKLDEGCIVFNKNKNDGYIVATLDYSRRTKNVDYWKDSFLHVISPNDDYHQTIDVINLFKDFALSDVVSNCSMSRSEIAVMINKCIDVLSDDDNISIDSLSHQVFKDESLQAKFFKFKSEFEEKHRVNFPETIQLSVDALRKKATGKLTKIKLDKNFELNICNLGEMLERGFDKERGLNYYKLWFENER